MADVLINNILNNILNNIGIVGFYAAILAILFFVLSIKVIGVRRKLKIGLGLNSNINANINNSNSEKDVVGSAMLRVTRVHANFAEYVPLALLLILLAAIQQAPVLLIHALCICLCLGRSLHAYGVSQNPERFTFRVSGMMLTFSVLLTSSFYLIYKFLLYKFIF